MYRILIVEDDETLAVLLMERLGAWGFEAHRVTRFDRVLQEFLEVQPHLVLMDVSLPFYNGFYWCGEIRKVSKAPVLFLSSHGENLDIVMAVNMGGDDYITKPFSMEVVVAKVNALLRRAYSYAEEARPVLEAQGALLDTASLSLSAGGRSASLTKNEARILTTLMERKNEVVSREKLMRELWDDDSFVDDNTLTVNINRLRKKLEDLGLPEFIATKKGLGYMVHD